VSPIFFTEQELAREFELRPPDDPRRENDFGLLARLAGRQHGAVAGWQTDAIGLDGWWLGRQVERQRLHSISEGVYAVGHRALSRRGLAVGALLRAGPGSALSHMSAARMWGLVAPSTGGAIHVSVARRRGLPSTEDVDIHRPRRLPTSHVVIHRGLPVTTPERTIRDLLAKSTVAEITRMLEQAVTVLGRDPDELHAWAKTLNNTRGLNKLFEALDHVVGPALIRSELESKFRSLCQTYGLPMPETNVKLGPWEVDALYRDACVAIELDSWRFHGGRWQFHRDRRKGLALNRMGFEVVRLTWAQIKNEPDEVASTLRVVLARATTRRG
jgi:hypothetical protein